MSAQLAAVTASLWPRAPYASWFVAGASQRASEAYGRDPGGRILDVGALRDAPGGVEVLTPNGWAKYIEREHQSIANVYNRVGAGWSFGSNSIHNAARGWFETIHRRQPDAMENIDIQFNRSLFESLRTQALGQPEPPPPPPPPPPPLDPRKPDPPVTQPPPPGGLQALSTAEQRAEELRIWLSGGSALLPGGPKVEQAVSGLLGDSAWKSFTKLPAVELIRVWRLLRKTLGDSREIPKQDR
jgi:hypothetical protein